MPLWCEREPLVRCPQNPGPGALEAVATAECTGSLFRGPGFAWDGAPDLAAMRGRPSVAAGYSLGVFLKVRSVDCVTRSPNPKS